MKKLTKKSLDELARTMPRIGEIEQRSFIGGGNGSKEMPYTVEEFDYLSDNGLWNGGYVDGWGYTGAETVVVASGTSNGGSGSGNWNDPDPFEDTNISGYWDASGNFVSGDWSGGIWSGGVWVENPDNNQTGNGNTGGGGGGNTSNPLDSDPYAVILGVLNGQYKGTYEQRWKAMEKAFNKILSDMGVNLFGISFSYEEGRSGKAWKVSQFGREIAIGMNFFKLSVEDSISVLVHESMHVNSDVYLISLEKRKVNLSFNYNVPESIKQYVNKAHYAGGATEFDYQYSFSCDELAVDPNYYKNEVNAYTKEKELCPNVSADYQAERDYKIWYYGKLAELAENY